MLHSLRSRGPARCQSGINLSVPYNLRAGPSGHFWQSQLSRPRTHVPIRSLHHNYNVNNFSRSKFGLNAILFGVSGLNVAVWLMWNYARERRDRDLFNFLCKNFLLNKVNLSQGRVWTVLTSAVSHSDLGHISFNMLTFVSFGMFLVAKPGLSALNFFSLIVGSALGSSAAFIVHDTTEGIRGPVRSALGLSGVCSGIVVASAAINPGARVAIMGIIPMPMWVAALVYIAYDTWALDRGDGIGHDAHLGGTLAGLLWYILAGRRFGGILGLRGLR